MELFESIGLKADPFTTSPNPDLFFPAKEHKQCLEGLELAIRMRRGLSVVRGGIGTGKTTISRKLIQNFNADEDKNFDFYPILDPKFESELVLLQHLVDLFGIEDEAGASVQECRNQIEHHLINVGVEEGRVLVLIIDEGQNLKGEFLDVFRTLLNFETDDFKLLQLVIFGQPEMTSIIHEYPNFEDRITFNFELGPLDLESTTGVIKHRLSVSGGENKEWFSDEAVKAIHQHTQGYPRKINKICHQLLLNMMSEEADSISQMMVESTIGGKAPTGLIESEEPEEAETGTTEETVVEEVVDEKKDVAVNKLFDILRKGGKKETGKIGEDVTEDDIIGDLYGDQEDEDDDDELEEEIIEDEDDGKWFWSRRKRQSKYIGSYPPNVGAPALKKEKILMGVAMDQGYIYLVVIQDKGGVKSFLAGDAFPCNKPKLDPKRNPTGFSVAISKAHDQLVKKIERKGNVNGSTIKKISAGCPIALTLNNVSSVLKTVEVPLESKKDRDMIIEYDAKKNLPFNADDIIYDAIELDQGKNIIGVANADYIDTPAKILSDKNWDIRIWTPAAQTILNVFRWNYPEKKHDIVLIFHIGEIESFLFGYNQGHPDAIVPLDLGIQNLTDAWKYRAKVSKAKWYKRDYCRVPPSILRSDDKSDPYKQKKPQDDAMRPTIESWDQELERALNSMTQSFPVDNVSEIFLSGCAKEIMFLDEYLESQFEVPVNFIDPIKNIAFHPSEDERENFDLSKPALTTAVGAALNLSKSVNLLPDRFKEAETFRLGNRFGIPVAATILLSIIILSGWTSYNHDNIETDLNRIRSQAKNIEPIKASFETISSNKFTTKEQLAIIDEDSELSRLTITIMRFFSYNSPKEVTLDLISFQKGWERKDWIHIGNSLEQVITIVDEDKHFARITGSIVANPALKERYFSKFIDHIEVSGLFKDVDVINKKTTTGMDIDNMSFELKCEL